MLIADSLKDLRGSKYDDSQAFDKQCGISSVELNVVLAGISRFKTHSLRDDKGDSFGRRFPLALRNLDSILPAMNDFVC